MCKINFTMPVIPEGATAEEKRSIMWNALSNMSVSEYLEQRDNLSYLPWANCFDILKSIYPSATYKAIKNEQGLPYFADPNTGIMVFTEINIDGVTTECFLPVMDYRNKAMKLEPYTYQAWDSFKKTYVDKTVAAATMFDINKTIWRCLVKNVAIATAIGIGVFQGEDVPEKNEEDGNSAQKNQQQRPQQSFRPTPTPQQKQTTAPAPTMQTSAVDPNATLRNAINATTEVSDLVSIYLDNTQVIENNPELKNLLTNRKKALQSLNKAA